MSSGRKTQYRPLDGIPPAAIKILDELSPEARAEVETLMTQIEYKVKARGVRNFGRGAAFNLVACLVRGVSTPDGRRKPVIGLENGENSDETKTETEK